jgi:hypothetical protein
MLVFHFKEIAKEKDDKGRWCVSYETHVVLRAGGVSKEDVGYGHGINRSLGKACESAGKESVTDGLKRAARTLGNSLGLALYVANKTHVSEVEDTPAPKKARRKAAGPETAVANPAPADPGAAQKVVAAITAAATVSDLDALRTEAQAFRGTELFPAVRDAYLSKRKLLLEA